MLQGEHSAILSTFIKLPFSIKTFVLSIFKWPLMTGFTVLSVQSRGGYGAICPLFFIKRPLGKAGVGQFLYIVNLEILGSVLISSEIE